MTLLHSIISITHCFVELPNGESTQFTHIGLVHLSTHLTLEHVLCVPSFSFNLLYVSKLTQRLPYCLLLLSQFCLLQDLTCLRTIGVGEVDNGLYLLQNSTSKTSSFPSSLTECLSTHKHINSVHSTATSSSPNMSTIWHFRLGHPSFNKLLHLKDVLSSFFGVCTDVCTVCPLEK